jgi:hypothetical protein
MSTLTTGPQGENLSDLKDDLRDLYEIFIKEEIIGIKKVEELTISI